MARGESYYFILIAMNNAAECNVGKGGGGWGGCRSARRVRRGSVGGGVSDCAHVRPDSRAGSCQCQSELAAWQRVVSVTANHFITHTTL